MRFVYATLGLVAVLAFLIGIKGAQISSLIASAKAFEGAGPPPEVVGTAVAAKQTWETVIPAVGTIVSSKGVVVSAEVAGTVRRIGFESGRSVPQGAVLVELDATVERAQLAATRARLDFAESTLRRSKPLAATGAITASELDSDVATFDSLTAEAQALEFQIAKKTVRAPFAGTLGIRSVNLGQYLTTGTPIVELTSARAPYVDFTLPQQHLGRTELGMLVRVTLEGQTKPFADARISAIDTTVDPATRSVHVRADLPEASGEAVRPGTYVTVAVVVPDPIRVVAVPVTSVVRASYGDSLFVVRDAPGARRSTPDGKPIRAVRQQFVRLGETRGDFVAVVEGVEAGQEVVSAGAFKLRNESPVVVDNTVQPKAELAPHVENR